VSAAAQVCSSNAFVLAEKPMAKSMKKRSRRGVERAALRESRSAEVLTIGWMLMVLTALVCELGFLLAQWLAAGQTEGAWAVLMALLLFASTVIGLFILLLTPVVIKSRRTPPPQRIIAFAVIVGAAPLAIIVLQLMSA
jgi:hypothetical protein